jgi:hypothetical protein
MKRNVFLQDVPNVSVNRGLIVYQINPSDGSLESSAVFDMTVGGLAIGSMITNFNNTLNGLYIYMYIYIYIYMAVVHLRDRRAIILCNQYLSPLKL